MMRNKGVEVQGYCITPAILHSQLQSNGVSSDQLRSLLNPNDKQDVVLCYSLLKEIWELPPPPAGATPTFMHAHDALWIYGEFVHHLITPYICIDLNMDEQLIHLSTAAHLACHLYTDNSAQTHFMPNQSYVDIMIMVKNTFYCVVKTKVNNPTGKFYITLLGTDRLESFFGLVQTAIGTDTDMDIVQLGSWVSGLAEVAVILAMHPEWDRSPRQLRLVPIMRDSDNVSSQVDHINPASWQGSTCQSSYLLVLRVAKSSPNNPWGWNNFQSSL